MSAQSAIYNPSQTTSAATGDGFSVPRLTTTGRLAITFGTADAGMMVYDTTLNNLFIWTGSAWESVPASGDAGANGSVQYNDNGVVSGASNFIYDKATSAVSITGDLTVDTSTLKVDSTNNRVGIGTASPTVPLYVTGNNATATAIMQDETNGAKLRLLANSINFDITNGGGGGDIAVSGANPLTFRINGSEQMRLNSTGLGVGVTPSAWGSGLKALQVGARGYGAYFDFNNDVVALSSNLFWTGSNYGRISASSKYAVAYYQDIGSGSHQWLSSSAAGTNGVAPTMNTNMVLDASGNLFLGGTAQIASCRSSITNVGGDQLAINATNTSTGQSAIKFCNAGTAYGYIWWDKADSRLYVQNTSGGVYLASTATSWTANSDERLKDIIEPINNAVAKVGSLRAIIGKYKNDQTNTRRSFLIAQDVQSVLPEAVDASNPDQLGVAYTDVIPLLVAAIKELTARVQTLEAR